jgi:hypothetical protein
MYKMKMKIVKYVTFFLIGIAGMDAWAADMTCVHWETTDGVTYIYHDIPVCFYNTGYPASPGTTGYCIIENGQYSYYRNKIDGSLCSDGSDPDCTLVDVFYTNAASAGGCALGGDVWEAILPLGDTCIPFLLFIGLYATILYFREKRQVA